MIIHKRTTTLYLRLITFLCLFAILARWTPQSSTGSNVVMAQGVSCPDLVKNALAAAENLCANTKRNQACYGNACRPWPPHSGTGVLMVKTYG